MKNKFVLKNSNGGEIINPHIEGLKVNFIGEGSYVEIHEGSYFVNTQINVSNESTVIIKKTHPFGIKNSFFCASGRAKNNLIFVGENFYVSNSARIVCEGSDNAEIKIGRDNMWSSDIVIRGSDSHQIFDLDTLEVLNFKRETIIGDNVWIGSQAVIMKGSQVPTGSIIGQSTIITKQFEEENTVIVGNPARVVKRNVGWSQDYIWDSKEVQIGDKNKEKKILAIKKPLCSFWELVTENNSLKEIKRVESTERDKWVKFILEKELIKGHFYYLVLEYQANISTQFTLFLTNSSNEIFRLPSYWAKQNQLRKIVFPFTPNIENLIYISISASHFTENSNLKILDFRVEKYND